MDADYSGPLILETYDRVAPLKTLAYSRTYVLERLKAGAGAQATVPA
jgi:hypothetical protein